MSISKTNSRSNGLYASNEFWMKLAEMFSAVPQGSISKRSRGTLHLRQLHITSARTILKSQDYVAVGPISNIYIYLYLSRYQISLNICCGPSSGVHGTSWIMTYHDHLEASNQVASFETKLCLDGGCEKTAPISIRIGCRSRTLALYSCGDVCGPWTLDPPCLWLWHGTNILWNCRIIRHLSTKC